MRTQEERLANNDVETANLRSGIKELKKACTSFQSTDKKYLEKLSILEKEVQTLKKRCEKEGERGKF